MLRSPKLITRTVHKDPFDKSWANSSLRMAIRHLRGRISSSDFVFAHAVEVAIVVLTLLEDHGWPYQAWLLNCQIHRAVKDRRELNFTGLASPDSLREREPS